MKGFVALPLLIVTLFVLVGFGIHFSRASQPMPLKEEDSEASISAQASVTPSATPSPTAQSIKVAPAPVIDCTITATSDSLPPGMTHYLTAGLKDHSDPIKSVNWDYNGDGIIDSPNSSSWYSHDYKDPGSYTAKARVTLKDGTQTRWCSKVVTLKYNDVRCEISTTDASAQPLSSGKAPLKVFLNSGIYSDAVLDKDGVEGYLWDYDGDGNWDTSLTNTGSSSYTYNDPKNYTIRMQAKMKSGRTTGVCTANVNVTN